MVQEWPKITEYTEISPLIVMRTASPIKRGLNKCLRVRVCNICACVCVCVCIMQCICVRALEDLCMLCLARKFEENKQCLYYSNEYALGSKRFNFPLAPHPPHPLQNTHKIPRKAKGNLWHFTLLAPNTAVFHCCLTLEPSPLENPRSQYEPQLIYIFFFLKKSHLSTTNFDKHLSRHCHFKLRSCRRSDLCTRRIRGDVQENNPQRILFGKITQSFAEAFYIHVSYIDLHQAFRWQAATLWKEL